MKTFIIIITKAIIMIVLIIKPKLRLLLAKNGRESLLSNLNLYKLYKQVSKQVSLYNKYYNYEKWYCLILKLIPKISVIYICFHSNIYYL